MMWCKNLLRLLNTGGSVAGSFYANKARQFFKASFLYFSFDDG